MTGREDVERVVAILGQHIARDRYDDDGASIGTYCTCGGWEGDYFADGEAGPFDAHLADHIAPLIEQARRDGAAEALREAADDIWRRSQQGHMVIHDAGIMQGEARWLRDRAERAAQTPQQFAQGVGRGEVDPESTGSDLGPQRGPGGRDV